MAPAGLTAVAANGAALRRGYADIDDGQVHFRTRPGEGVPVVFLHQTASSGAMWEAVMARWSGRHPLYAFDTPGFGGSFDPAEPTSIPQYAGWIDSAVAAVAPADGRYHVVGHHTGAAIALELAARRPDRIASVAMIGLSCLGEAERRTMADRLGRPFRPVRSGAYLLKNWEYLRVGGADRDVGLLHREMVDMLRAWAARPHAYAAAWGQDAAALLAEVRCPAIAMAAPDDLLFPSLARIGAIRADITRVLLSGGANFEPDLVPDEVATALVEHVARAEQG